MFNFAIQFFAINEYSKHHVEPEIKQKVNRVADIEPLNYELGYSKN